MSIIYELTTFLALYYDKTYKYIVHQMIYHIEEKIPKSTHITSRCYNKFLMHVYKCIPCQLIYTTDGV